MITNNTTENEIALTADVAATSLLAPLPEENLSTADVRRCLSAYTALYTKGELTNLTPVLPFLLRLKGVAYHLNKHFPMEPMFSLVMPRTTVYKSARQVSKSTTLAAQSVVMSALIPHFYSLYICPRFEQTRRFSNNYIKPFIIDSPIGHAMVAKEEEQSVLQRTFINGARQHFSFAFLDCERIRGISSSINRFDELQDIDTSFIPVINETLSASDYDLRQYAGTPKTFDNALQYEWEKSSMAEWVTQCDSCKKWNIATVECDLLGMIQREGLSCAFCIKKGNVRPLNPRTGHWEHTYEDRIVSAAGYHVPQPIMPMHCEVNPLTGRKDKWQEIWYAKTSMSKAVLYNEKLGESCDVRSSLLTREILKANSTMTHSNTVHAASKLSKRYVMQTMGVDWGGGGEKGVSYTTIAILGHHPSGKVDLLYGERLIDAFDPLEEAAVILRYMKVFNCSLLGHDANGSGAIREVLLLQAGLPMKKIFGAAYHSVASANLVTYKPPTTARGRGYYIVDKARSLMLLCQTIRSGLFRFPQFESWEHLASDFLALVEDKRESARGSDIYVITRKSNVPDDFAHSVNYAALAFWHSQARYPDLAAQLPPTVSDLDLEELHPDIPIPLQ